MDINTNKKDASRETVPQPQPAGNAWSRRFARKRLPNGCVCGNGGNENCTCPTAWDPWSGG